MFSRLLALATLALVPSLAAQVNQLEIWSATRYTSRGNIGNGTGEIHQNFPSANFAGVGDNGKTCVATGAGCILQDQNKMTQERFSLVCRSGSGAKGPTTGKGAVIGIAGPFATPKGTAPGAAAWGFGLAFKTPLDKGSCTADAFLGVSLPVPFYGWSADGLSCHASGWGNDLAHLLAPENAWQIVGKDLAARTTSGKRAWRIGHRGTSAVLQPCNGAPATPGALCGNGGMFPNSADVTGQPLRMKVTDKIAGQMDSHLFVGLGFSPRGLNILGKGARLWLNPTFLMYGGKTTLAGGIGWHPVTTKLPKGILGNVAFQAVTTDGKLGQARFTNATITTILK